MKPATLHEEGCLGPLWSRFPRSLVHTAALVLYTIISTSLALAQNAHYTVTNITVDLSNHHSPSINNKQEIVWSQLDSATGFWQILSNSAGRLTSDTDNHYNPVIDDNGDVVYLKDGQGGGPGLAVVENVGGVESTLEFSSGDPPGCTEPPAGPPTCTSWRAAGQHFGLAKTANVPTVISYHDFCNPNCVRTFDVSTIGTLPLTTTTNLDFPDINNQSVFGGTGTPAPVFIFSSLGSLSSASTSFPNSQTLILAGSTSQRLADTGEIAFVRAGNVISTSGGTIDLGLSADINNDGQIAYEKVINSFSQILLASPVTSLCGDNRDLLNGEYTPGVPYSTGVLDSTTGSLFVPLCSYETQAVNSQYFKFKQTCNGQPCGLNTGQYTWAPIRRPLVIPANSGYGLDQFKVQSDVLVPPATYGPRQITSAYRNPQKNFSLKNSKPTSRHMFGDAVDFNNNSCLAGSQCKTTSSCGSSKAQNEYDGMKMAAMNSLATYIEPINVSFCAHVHADWRGISTSGTPPCPYAWCSVNSRADYVP